MKLLPDGPDIPDALLAAQERGEVMFVCGAGVSMTLGLPSFRGLVGKIYHALGENWDLHPAEREVMRDDGRLAGQYDRVLRFLERRLSDRIAGRPEGLRQRFRNAVVDALQPSADELDLASHAALLDLSRDAENNIRLVTTNFDTLFERAWPRGGVAPSFAGPAMPQPKSPACRGILHLHGRLADESLVLSETDLVLTSAEFGDAYLRSGWAARYVYDLVRAYKLVLVGYSADDPPMRYLLEVLEADRERYPDLQEVYAFDAAGSDEVLTAALWRAKGVTPILHAQDPGGGYGPLYRSIREWRAYAQNPTAWRRAQLEPLLSSPPSTIADVSIARVGELLRRGDAEEQLAALSPPAAWLPVLREQRVFDDGRSPGAWIAKRLGDPEMIRATAALPAIDGVTERLVDWAIGRDGEALKPLHAEAWGLVLRAARAATRADPEAAWYRLAPRIKTGRASYEARRVVAECLRPRLTVRRPVWLHDEPEEPSNESLHGLLWIDFEVSASVPVFEIIEGWPDEGKASLDLLLMLERRLSDALEEAEEVGFTTGYDRSDHDVPSIAEHPQNRHRSGFFPIVRVIARLWENLATREPEAAREIAIRWSRSRFTLLQRLAIHAHNDELFEADALGQLILGLDDRQFWVTGAQVEIMRGLVSRWASMRAEQQQRLEARLLRGIPRDLFETGAFDEEAWASIYDDSTYRRLTRLRGSGHALSGDALKRITAIEARHPKWRPRPGDRDDFHGWSESSSGPSGDVGLLKGVADGALVAEALRIQQESQFEQGDLWRKFCDADPDRALRGLRLQAQAGDWAAEAWRCLFWSADRRDDPALVEGLADVSAICLTLSSRS